MFNVERPSSKTCWRPSVGTGLLILCAAAANPARADDSYLTADHRAIELPLARQAAAWAIIEGENSSTREFAHFIGLLSALTDSSSRHSLHRTAELFAERASRWLASLPSPTEAGVTPATRIREVTTTLVEVIEIAFARGETNEKIRRSFDRVLRWYLSFEMARAMGTSWRLRPWQRVTGRESLAAEAARVRLRILRQLRRVLAPGCAGKLAP